MPAMHHDCQDFLLERAGTVANANPIILDSRGEAMVYLDGTYMLVLTTSADAAVWTVDNVEGSGSVNVTKLSAYSDLVTAVSLIGATECTLYIDKDDVMSANVIVPTTMQLHFLKGNTVSTTGYTLTIAGGPDSVIAASDQQILAGTGTVVFGKSGMGYTPWFPAAMSVPSNMYFTTPSHRSTFTYNGGTVAYTILASPGSYWSKTSSAGGVPRSQPTP